MRTIVLFFLIGLVACTKTNPNVCCTDAADCSAAGIPNLQACADGLSCRSHQCIAETCSTSTDCASDAPYCSTSNGLCALTCAQDSECPGAAQTAADLYCIGAACVECRADTPSDCPSARPVCEAGTCTGCVEHTDCASGICAADGSCAPEPDISYVSPSGGFTSCSALSPCSLTQALTLTRKYIVIDSGTYALTATIHLSNDTWLVGRGNRPKITNPAHGYIIMILTGARVRLANLEISGATASTTQPGNGVGCESDGGAANRTLDLDNMLFTSNAGTALFDHTCVLTARRSVFRGNGGGMGLADIESTIDRCEFSQNGEGVYSDSGVTKITNSFAFRNAGNGFHLFGDPAATPIQFSTSVDNTGYGLVLEQSGTTNSSNNILARNGQGSLYCFAGNNQCLYDGTIALTGSDISALHFKSPDTQPYDYHLTAGSSAIDAAVTATLDHDFDGDARPKGAGRDVGADEAQ